MPLCAFLRLFHHSGWRRILEVIILFNFDTIQLSTEFVRIRNSMVKEGKSK